LSRGSAAASRKGDGDLREWLRQRLRKEIHVQPSPLEQPGRRFILCVGATGVGKTTTIAKLAARASLELGRRASILTFDTYRVGSVEQLSRFAQLIGLPFEVVHDTTSFCDALLAHPSELVFVDTASLPPSDHAWSRRVLDCLSSAPDVPVDVLIVAPAMISGEDAERLVSVYQAPAATAMVITKLDEFGRAGGAVQAAVNAKLPIAYLCRGPRVPEDLETPTADEVLDIVLPERP
jgi:flagellar biosynthesis protein FlhF